MKLALEKYKRKRLLSYTLDELSRISGISRNVLVNIDCGRKKLKPDSKEFLILSEILDMTVEEYFVRETKLLTFFNNKGGATKTSSVATISHILTKEFDKRVLMIDCDPQANLTIHYGMATTADVETRNLYQAYTKLESIKPYILPTGYDNLDIVLSHPDVGRIEPTLPSTSSREQRFYRILQEVRESGYYDFIICDCAPSLSLLNSMILRATDGVVVPVVPDAFNLAGLTNTLDYIASIIEENQMFPINPNINILGIFINDYDKRVKMAKIIIEVLQHAYSEEGYLFNTIIGTDASMGKAQNEKQPLGVKYSKNPAYADYKELVKEILERAQKI